MKNRNTNTIFVKYQVPLDERFIYRFFRDKQTRVSDKQDDDAESVNSDDAMEALEMFAEKGARDLDFASAVEPDQKTGNSYFFLTFFIPLRKVLLNSNHEIESLLLLISLFESNQKWF